MPYRSAREALESRVATIEAQLAQLSARRTEIDGLLAEVPALQSSLADARAQLTSVVAGEAPSPLDRIAIASPCKADWEAMDGDDQVRFCGSCRKNVYNISALSRGEAEALIADRTGTLCVRLFRRADGTVLTADCPEGVSTRRRRRLALAVVGSGALAAAAAVGLGARHARANTIEPCTLESTNVVTGQLMGEPEMPQTPPTAPVVEQPRRHVMGRMPMRPDSSNGHHRPR